MNSLNDFPGDLTQAFWERLQAAGFCKLSKVWNEREIQSVRTISYVFSHKPNPVQQEILSR